MLGGFLSWGSKIFICDDNSLFKESTGKVVEESNLSLSYHMNKEETTYRREP
jgi:hypothetical protein